MTTWASQHRGGRGWVPNGRKHELPGLGGPSASFPLYSVGQSSSGPNPDSRGRDISATCEGEKWHVCTGRREIVWGHLWIQVTPINLSKLPNLSKSQFPLLQTGDNNIYFTWLVMALNKLSVELTRIGRMSKCSSLLRRIQY